MADANRSRRAGALGLTVLLVAALVAWRLWPGEPVGTSALRDNASPAAATETTAATPRARRSNETAAPDAPEPAADTPVPPPRPGEPSDSKFPLEVTVLRADGTPAPGASVLLISLDDDEKPTASAQADDHGVATFRMPDDGFRVVAWLGAEAMATADLVTPRKEERVTVRLGPSMVVRGRVLRGDATPEPKADVELMLSPWFKSEFELRLWTKTDADGRFEFPPIALAGIHPLNPPAVEAITEDKARGFAEADPARPDAEVIVHLTPGFTVRARFVDKDGKPVVADLWAVGARRFHAENEDDGRVALRLVEARYELVAKRSRWDVRLASEPLAGEPTVDWTGRAIAVHEDGAGDVDLGDVVIPDGRPIRGRVVDTAGAPAARAGVSLYLGGVDLGETFADEDGRFEFPEVGDQPHRIYVRTRAAEIGAAGDRTAEVENVRGGDSDVRVVLEDMLVIAFKFISEADRKPVACTQYQIRVKLHGDGFDWFGTDVVGDEETSTAFRVFTPGSYDVEVNVAGYEPMRFESVEVAAGRPTSLDLLLRKKHE